jgi:hypothetical protein
MHCGAEVTESSTNKQHHLSETRLALRMCLEMLFSSPSRDAVSALQLNRDALQLSDQRCGQLSVHD